MPCATVPLSPTPTSYLPGREILSPTYRSHRAQGLLNPLGIARAERACCCQARVADSGRLEVYDPLSAFRRSSAAPDTMTSLWAHATITRRGAERGGVCVAVERVNRESSASNDGV